MGYFTNNEAKRTNSVALALYFLRKGILQFFTFYAIDINPLSQLLKSLLLNFLPALPSPMKGWFGRDNVFQTAFDLGNVSSIKKSWTDNIMNSHSLVYLYNPWLAFCPIYVPLLSCSLQVCLCLNGHTQTHFPLCHLKGKGHHNIKHKPLDMSPYVLF